MPARARTTVLGELHRARTPRAPVPGALMGPERRRPPVHSWHWGPAPVPASGGLGGLLTVLGGEGVSQDLVDLAGQVEGHLGPDRLGDVLEVGAIALGQDDLLEPGPVGGSARRVGA